jgi:hypothetical protein
VADSLVISIEDFLEPTESAAKPNLLKAYGRPC